MPKDGNKFASFGKPPEVKLSEGSARGEASFRKPPEVKLPEGRPSFGRTRFFSKQVQKAEGSRRTRFFQIKFASSRRKGVLRLPSESRHPARGEASRRKRRSPFLREEAEGRPSFGRKPKDVLFSKQVHQAARGEASRRTFRKKLLPSGTSGASYGKPPEVKLPEGRSEKSCFLREPLALPSGRASS